MSSKTVLFSNQFLKILLFVYFNNKKVNMQPLLSTAIMEKKYGRESNVGIGLPKLLFPYFFPLSVAVVTVAFG